PVEDDWFFDGGDATSLLAAWSLRSKHQNAPNGTEADTPPLLPPDVVKLIDTTQKPPFSEIIGEVWKTAPLASDCTASLSSAAASPSDAAAATTINSAPKSRVSFADSQ